jgi:hypothetical protein
MNEQRIRELSEQASIHAEETVHYYTGQPDGLTWEAKILKARDLKFAELIVRECGVALSPMLRDMVSRGQAYDLIKQHFGVTE